MPLHRISDFDSNYRQHFDNQDVIGYDLYSSNDKVGSVDDLLVEDSGNLRYLVINTGAWIFGKKVLLPIGRTQISHADRRVYVDGLSRTDVENLPEFDGNIAGDYDYEEQVRGVYRPMTGVESADPASYDRATYTYDQEPALYNLNDRDHQNLKLYEERLIANKTRQKTGEVAIGKRIETETQRVSVPVEKDRIVVERVAATGDQTAVTPGEATFAEVEVARMETYEETPDIRKEAFVREAVNIRKEVDRDTVETEDQIRREELDVNTDGRPNVRQPNERL